MIGRWFRHLVWRPYEISCRRLPLIPLRASVESPCSGVKLIRVSNVITRLVSALGGGYDYSVSYLLDGTLLIDTGFPWVKCGVARVSGTGVTLVGRSHGGYLERKDLPTRSLLARAGCHF